jgi:hypothetical protein
VKADTYELKTILAFERRYVIPTFQRDYEWTKDEQWSLLYDDLESVADRLEESRQIAEISGQDVAKAASKVAPHFLGAIVLDALSHSPGSLDLNAVIDGQQRLTTIQLLLRGVLDVLLEQESIRAKSIRRLTANPADVVLDPDEGYKLWPRRRDRDVWRVAMADEPDDGADHLYLQARSYFAERTRVAFVASDGSDRSDVVVDALIGLFKLVVISLEDNDDAQVIFEVLNGRQTPLSATDLVKNLLFMRAEFADEAELEKLYDEHWAHFDDKWWKKEIGRGHAARGRRDVLLSSWLTIASETEVNLGHLYGQVREYLNDGDHKIPDILNELSTAATAFRDILERPSTLPTPMAHRYARVDRLSVTTAIPLLVWLRTLPESLLPPGDHLRCVAAVDSWIMRRVIVGANTRGYGKRFVDVLKAAKRALADDASIPDAVEAALLDAGDSNLTWPTDDEVLTAFVERPFYDNLTQERIRMILGALDYQMHLDHPKGEHPVFNYDSLQIEHLLPQKWRTHWPIDCDDDAERALLEMERDRVRNRLGNLTLITGPLNIPMSNGPWSDKRLAIAQHSNLQLNAGVDEVESWDEDSIADRARSLTAVAVRVWRRPGQSLAAEAGEIE